MTTQPDLHYRSLADVAGEIRSGALSSVEVTRHMLDRIARLEPVLHAFAEVRGEAALNDAAAADARLARGQAIGPLHGVPLAIKDLCAMAGTRTGAGGFFPTGIKESNTATVVMRLQDAGAIIIGKAQLTEGAWSAHHPRIPAPVNPWAEDHWAGASSSGSGVAVAAGLAYGAVGTDTAGSIRLPSACNHLVGLKPSWGRVSRSGVFPLSDTFDHVGPMARCVLDVTLMYAAMAGPDALDPTTRNEPIADVVSAARAGTLNGLRIGVDPAYSLGGLDGPTSAALNAVIAQMEARGAEFVEVRVPDVDEILPPSIMAMAAEAAVSHSHSYPSDAAKYGPVLRDLLDLGLSATAADCASVAIWRREFRGAMDRLFGSIDMLITPVLPLAPPCVADMKAMEGGPPLASAGLMRYTIPFNLAGLPSLTLPMARAPSGVPLGFQLIGPDLGEAALLSAGAGFEEASGFSSLHPAI